MTIDWTTDSDEEGTIFIRLHPRDGAERKLIIDALIAVLPADTGEEGSDRAPATLYAEDEKFVYGVADPDQNGAVMTRKDKHGATHLPILDIHAFPQEEDR